MDPNFLAVLNNSAGDLFPPGPIGAQMAADAGINAVIGRIIAGSVLLLIFAAKA